MDRTAILISLGLGILGGCAITYLWWAVRHSKLIHTDSAQLNALRQQVCELESRLHERNEAPSQNGSRLKALVRRNAEIQSRLTERDQRIADLCQELEYREQSIAAAHAEVRAVREAESRDQAQLEAQQATIDVLRERLRKYEAYPEDSKAQLRAREARIEAIQSESAALLEDLPALNDALREREISIEDLTKELARQRKRYTALQSKMIESGKIQAEHPPAQVIRLRECREQRATGGLETSETNPVPDNPNSETDDLKQIHGIGSVLERRLNEMGLHRYDQIAALSDTDITRITAQLNTPPGRIESDNWIAQARILARGTADGGERTDREY